MVEGGEGYYIGVGEGQKRQITKIQLLVELWPGHSCLISLLE